MSSVMRLLLRPLDQEVPRSNARQGALRLAQQRRQREEVDAYLAQLPVGPTVDRRERREARG
jgi:hypothetical protein